MVSGDVFLLPTNELGRKVVHPSSKMALELVSSMLAPVDALNEHLDTYVQAFADLSGFLPLDQARYLCCALATYPLALLFRFIPNIPSLKVRPEKISLFFFFFSLRCGPQNFFSIGALRWRAIFHLPVRSRLPTGLSRL
jgi:hypothetical protein